MLGIRVSTVPAFGLGHVARCIAIREQFSGPVRWYVDQTGGEYLSPSEADAVICERDPADLGKFTRALETGELQAGLIDCRGVGGAAVTMLAENFRIAAFSETKPYPRAALVIDPQLTGEPGPGRLTGPDYLAFSGQERRRSRHGRRTGQDKFRLLIAFGARDSVNHSAMVVDAVLESPQLSDRLQVSIVVGAQSPHAEGLAELAGSQPGWTLFENQSSLWSLYEMHDIAVGAPGVSHAERCYSGLPSLLVAQNPDQMPLVQAWVAQGAALACSPEPGSVRDALWRMIIEENLRESISAAGRRLVDGSGARRIAEALTVMMVEARQ